MDDHHHTFTDGDHCACGYQRVKGEAVESFGRGRSAEQNRKISDAILTDPKRGTPAGK